MLKKLLIANRGEIAVRIIRTCQELEISTVAVYSDADSQALHVRLADQAVRVGPPPAARSYLDVEAILEAISRTGADAVHPGYGFLAERPGFAAACRAGGVTFVGPSPEAIARMGDKVAARRCAEEAGVPIVPGSAGAVSLEEALVTAREIGYPVAVKALAGGGGHGIRVASDEGDLRAAVEAAEREANAAFGEGAVYLEKQLEHPRHVEVQILADEHGHAVHLYERECSLQRRRQKLAEEAPAPALDAETRRGMTEAALRVARAAGYTNAGTVEFLVDEEERFYFLEMNARIQVEHPVTEMVTGIDLVREQIRIAAGEPLGVAQEDIALAGHAIEVRINAEDPERNFRPSPGKVGELRVPGGPGVRVDSALYAGYTVVPFYDSLVSKLIVWHRTREGAISRCRRALREYRVDGIKTTIPFHLRLLADEGFRRGRYHTGYLERLL